MMSIYKHSGYPLSEDGLALKGYQKKLKTMKKKYFVLYEETNSTVARLEYYDNERKFKSGLPPKRIIHLRNCFNINRRLDTRYDFVISLSTKDGPFGIVLETESEMIKWLETLISLQRNDANTSDDANPQFEHFWQVTVERRGLAEEKGLIGHYYVGLTAQSLIFIRIGTEKTTLGEARLPKVEFPLNTIRRCGDSQCYFYIEVGRKSIIGPGEFWMKTDNSQTAESMHSKILSAMSLKSETSMEPMRKRSSSANEASKPINVLQKRQNQQEIKVNNSPQAAIGFSRERCDSLPSRNRTSSECNSQNLSATSTLSVRNFAMSGLRPHSYQRHSNSPPMNSTLGCSESEESSVSIDEPDDNGSFISYRFNSRSSEGVIPEENTDELLGVEIKQVTSKGNLYSETKPESLSSLGNNEESYLSMAPVNTFKENRIKTTDECRYVPSNSSSLRGVPSSIMEFPEYVFDKMSKNASNETDSQFERPARAYSIGSKTEHIKFNKRTTNLNDIEQNTMRVRAFSVGSRAKIPRCDLQRGVLSPKSMMEHNCNSNNNICSFNETCNLPHHLINTTSCSEKKSTSAPLLIHKSQNSVDRMSDLMEIDFSKSSNNSTNRIYSSPKTPIVKNLLLNNRDQTTRNETSLHTSVPVAEETNPIQKSFSPIIETAISHTDNGYLEMKPVGDSLIKNSPTKHFKDSSNTYSAANILASVMGKKSSLTAVPENKVQSKPHILQPVLINKREVFESGTGQNESGLIGNMLQQDNNKVSSTDSKIKEDCQEKPTRKLTPISDNIGVRIPIKSDKSESKIKEQTKMNILTVQYNQLTKDLNQKQKPLQQADNNSSKDDYINIIQKNNEQISAHLKNNRLNTLSLLTHTISDEDKDNKHDESGRKISSNETGYEILQIKSDSSLQSHKSLNRHNANRKDKQLCQQTPSRPRSTNSSTITSSSNLSGCTSSSTSCLNYLSTPHATPISKGDLNNSQSCKVNNASSTSNTNASTTSTSTTTSTTTSNLTTSPLNLVSRPPSVSSEHELYYASLDLPQTSDINVKLNKLEISNGSSPIAEITSANNSYAKIDFDVSDSSSSSSKNVNN